jgi:transposase-like protein
LSLRPQAAPGQLFLALLGAAQEVEKALVTVIQEAWIGGVSTRLDELAQAMGPSGILKSQVSKLCKGSDERVNAFLDRPLDGEWPYLWLIAGLPPTSEAARLIVMAPRRGASRA